MWKPACGRHILLCSAGLPYHISLDILWYTVCFNHILLHTSCSKHLDLDNSLFYNFFLSAYFLLSPWLRRVLLTRHLEDVASQERKELIEDRSRSTRSGTQLIEKTTISPALHEAGKRPASSSRLAPVRTIWDAHRSGKHTRMKLDTSNPLNQLTSFDIAWPCAGGWLFPDGSSLWCSGSKWLGDRKHVLKVSGCMFWRPSLWPWGMSLLMHDYIPISSNIRTPSTSMSLWDLFLAKL